MRCQLSRRLVATLMCIGLLLIACSQALAADRALLIGVSKYADSGIPPLPGVVNDLELMRDLLENNFDVPKAAIKVLRDSQATRAGILDSIDNWLIQGTQPGDRVFLHYSGHGSYLPDLDGDESGPNGDGVDETLVAFDVTCSALGTCENMVLDDEIGERLTQLSDRYVLTVFDACNSGTATRSMGIGVSEADQAAARLFRPEAYVADLQGNATRSMPSMQGDSRAQIDNHHKEGGFVPGQANHVNLFAVQSFQLALEVTIPGLPRSGLFTRNIYDALKDNKADRDNNGAVSFSELDLYVNQSTKRYCESNKTSCKRAGGVVPKMEVPASLIGTNVLDFGKFQQADIDNGLDEMDVTAILAQSNDANLRIALEPGTVLQPDDRLRFNVSADRGGVLFLFDLDAGGKLTLLYPTDTTPSINGNPPGWIHAGSRVIVPDSSNQWQYVIETPYGKGVAFAILAERYQEYPGTRNFAVVGRENSSLQISSAAALGELRLTLDRLVGSVDNEFLRDRSEWSMVNVEYEVVPK